MARIDPVSLPRVSLVKFSRAAMDGLLGLVLILSLAALLAQWFWLADMLSFFRPLLLGASLAVLLVLLLQRRRLRSGVAVVLVIVNLIPLTVRATAAPAPPDADAQPMRVMSANVLYGNTHFDAFRRAVGEINPDVLVTQESTGPWIGALQGLDGLPYRGVEAGSSGLLKGTTQILSRFPLTATRVGRNMNGMERLVGGGRAVRAEVRPPGRTPFVVYAIHAPTPRTNLGWQERTTYLEGLAALIAAEPRDTRVIVVGDWNTPPWSPVFRRFVTETGLASAEPLPWPQATRRFAVVHGATLLGTPIDRIAVSPGIGVAGFHVGPAFGSDHVPVYADLALR